MSNEYNYISYQALEACDFTNEKEIIKFIGNEENEEIGTGEMIFHPDFGVYKVIRTNPMEMVLYKTIKDLVKEKQKVVIAEYRVRIRLDDRDDTISCFTYFLHDGLKYVEFDTTKVEYVENIESVYEDINKFIRCLSKQLQEKDDIIEQFSDAKLLGHKNPIK